MNKMTLPVARIKMKRIVLMCILALFNFREAESLTSHFGLIGMDITNTASEILRAVNKQHSFANMTMPEIVMANGYPAEIHHVTTEDGYILELHRIPFGKKEKIPTKTPRPVVFLHHCLLCSSSDFIMNTPDKALAYLLAGNGYDVWPANARGNTYSKKHVSLSLNDEEYWQFSWHEMGYYDLPAAIDYILAETGEKDVYYIGFSMGSSVFWVLMSERPEYASKIRFMVGIGPVAYVKNTEGPLRYVSWFSDGFMSALDLLGRHEVLNFGPVLDYIVSFFCDEERFTSTICHNSLFFICGANPDQLNKEFLPVILAHTPAGTSARAIHHFLQEIQSGAFRKYDYGKQKNMRVYGQPEPPSYNLDRVKPPVALFWSKNDWLASPKDVLHLLSKLPNVVHLKMIEDPLFTHLDFIWALQADELLYYPMLELMSKH
uniref:Lipase n=1 Tax=Neocaridina denticulata sinensis TaxID=274643 RepID=A0A9E8G0L6_NEODE|nr:gastric triacylglycerol lipase [Neocaridina denticulata sinensis]